MLELDSDTISVLSESKVLLSMKLADGELVFPSFQFRAGTYYPELIVSFQKFDVNTTGWEVAIWFNKWNENLHDFPMRLVASPEGMSRVRLTIDVEASLAKL